MGVGFYYPSPYLDGRLFCCAFCSNGCNEFCKFGKPQSDMGLSSRQLQGISDPSIYAACSSRFFGDNSNSHFGIDLSSLPTSCNYCLPRALALAKISTSSRHSSFLDLLRSAVICLASSASAGGGD